MKQTKQAPWWRPLALSLALLLLLLAILWATAGNALLGTREQQLEQAQQAVMRAVVTCYAVEGIYPPNLEYLYENYGLAVDTTRFFMDYEVFASNVLPQVTVYESGWYQ